MGWRAGWLVGNGRDLFQFWWEKKGLLRLQEKGWINDDSTTNNPQGIAQRTRDNFFICTVEVMRTSASGVGVRSCRENAYVALSKYCSCYIFSALASKMIESGSARFPGFAGSPDDLGTSWIITFFCSCVKAWISGGIFCLFVCLKQINRNSRNIN